MSTTTDCLTITCRVVAEQAGYIDPKDVKPDAQLHTLGLDSLDLTEVVMAFEDAYDIDIPDEAAENWLDQTPRQIAAYLDSRHTPAPLDPQS